MTLEAQNRAIAEVCGWRAVSVYEWKDGRQLPKQYHWDGVNATGLPNYTGSLDAMHEAVNTLPPEKRDLYQNWLSRVCDRKRRMAPISWLMLTAEATDQAEAFLRAVGRWQEKGEK